MKTVETKLYCFTELSEEAKTRVIEREANRVANSPDNPTLEECCESLKAIVEACGLRLRGWNIGPYNRNNFARVDCDDVGRKALARFLRVLIAHKYPRPATFKAMKFEGVCGFTGVCFDEDICEAVWEALLGGDTLGKAFDRVADKIRTICENDLKYRQTRECILHYLDQDAEIYTEDGDEF